MIRISLGGSGPDRANIVVGSCSTADAPDVMHSGGFAVPHLARPRRKYSAV
jgi:hypothetical protein